MMTKHKRIISIYECFHVNVCLPFVSCLLYKPHILVIEPAAGTCFWNIPCFAKQHDVTYEYYLFVTLTYCQIADECCVMGVIPLSAHSWYSWHHHRESRGGLHHCQMFSCVVGLAVPHFLFLSLFFAASWSCMLPLLVWAQGIVALQSLEPLSIFLPRYHWPFLLYNLVLYYSFFHTCALHLSKQSEWILVLIFFYRYLK